MIRTVTIVTPTYNSLQWLRGCRSSVSQQRFGSIQHVVVDGGSTDGTVEWLSEQRDIEWTSGPDDGQSDALVKGFAAARGDLLGWLNADDRLHPDACSTAVELANRGPVDVVLGACRFVDTDGMSLRTIFGPRHLRLRDLANDLPVNQPSTFFTASAYERVGGIDRSKHLAMDHDLWMKFAAHRLPTAATARVLSAFTIRADSKTGESGQADFVRETSASMAAVGPVGLARYMVGRLAATETLDAGSPTAQAVRPLAMMLSGEHELRGAGAELVRRCAHRDQPRLWAELIRAPRAMRAGASRMIATKLAVLSRQRALGLTALRATSEPFAF